MNTERSSLPTPHPSNAPEGRKLGMAGAMLGAVLMLAGMQEPAFAQSDNFDSGTLSAAWTKYHFNAGLVAYTFPTVGSGKGLRFQANPFPNQAPAAAAISQATTYTDFYVSLDVVNWAVNNQALVVIARWTPGGTAGLAGATGYILNYDAAQDGVAAGDRKGGELQINTVAPGFATATKAAGEITFVPGHSYRLIFQNAGPILKGEVYDLEDLTRPLVTIYADESTFGSATYPSGQSGFLSFSRDGTTGTTDVTIDNYQAAATDPNATIAPVIAHPIPGTPAVTNRVPAARWANFHNPASGIGFTATTFGANQINASATRLYLNGVDASASLAPLPANASTATFATAAGTLQANTIYAARIEIEDTTGTQKSTNTFWFDTFSDAYVASLKTIEIEDYNYSNGVYQLDPIPVSGTNTSGLGLVKGNVALGGDDTGYCGFYGAQGVDYSKPGGAYWLELAEYRLADRVQITQGSYTGLTRDEGGDVLDDVSNTPPSRIHSTQRAKYVAAEVWEYQVKLTSPGDWMNYTRNFAAGNYHVYLRCSSFGATTVYLDQVTANAAASNQTTVRHGSFNVDNHTMRLNYKYVPLMAGSTPAVINLSGLRTLRLTLGGTPVKDERLVNLDYLMLVPTADPPTVIYPALPPTVIDNFNDGNDTSPAWVHYDPLSDPFFAISNSTFSVTGGVYHIYTPAPEITAYGPARAGSFLAGLHYTDFYVSADLVDFDDTVRQAFGLAARVGTPGMQTTTGYTFTWEPGGDTLPNTTGGDLDISVLVGELPVKQIETAPGGLHLTRGKSYRFVFMGSGTNFEGQVYELPDTANPLIRLPANDPDNTYASGLVGLVVASESSITAWGDAIFDNFLVTTGEPRLTVNKAGSSVVLTWPFIHYRLQSSPSLSSPVWTDVSTGIVNAGGGFSYTLAPTDTEFFRLVYP